MSTLEGLNLRALWRELTILGENPSLRRLPATRSRLVQDSLDPVVLGPHRAFEDFYRAEYSGVVGLAFALTGNRWVSEDLAQEAFLAAHRNWSRIAAYERPGLWVRRVVANLSVSAFRRRVAEAKALGRIALRRDPVLPELPADDAGFWDAVRSLPRRQAQVVALYYLEDRPIAEVADILGMALGTVKKHLHDGRVALARRLDVGEESS